MHKEKMTKLVIMGDWQTIVAPGRPHDHSTFTWATVMKGPTGEAVFIGYAPESENYFIGRFPECLQNMEFEANSHNLDFAWVEFLIHRPMLMNNIAMA